MNDTNHKETFIASNDLSEAPVRIITRLDIKGPNVIKGVHLEGLKVVGQPGDMAQKYYEQGADEIIYMDVVASLYGRNNILSVVEQAAREIFIPLTVGGGIRNSDDIVYALRSGADKVAINTAALNRPNFLLEAAKTFTSKVFSKFEGRVMCWTKSCNIPEQRRKLLHMNDGKKLVRAGGRTFKTVIPQGFGPI